jgi:hypothetical protein
MDPDDLDDEFTDELDEPGVASEARPGKTRDQGDLERLALNHLSRARKLRSRNDWQPNGEADFYLAAADVLAKLELANALRDSRQR